MMRHYFVRLAVGIIWLVVGIHAVMQMNLSGAALSLLGGGAFLASAISIYQKEKKGGRHE